MSVTANIILNKKSQVLTVPNGTIKTDKNDPTKFYVMKKSTPSATTNTNVVASGTPRAGNRNRVITATDAGVKTYIITGISNDVDTEVLTGLSAGDEVVSKTVTGTAATTKTTSSFSLFGGAGGASGAARAGGAAGR
jgi:hypothetical protein